MDWFRVCQAEYDLTAKYIKKSMRGLTQKDHQKLREQLNLWVSEQEQHRKEQQREEREDIARDCAAIQTKKSIRSELEEMMQKRASAISPDDLTNGSLQLPSSTDK